MVGSCLSFSSINIGGGSACQHLLFVSELMRETKLGQLEVPASSRN